MPKQKTERIVTLKELKAQRTAPIHVEFDLDPTTLPGMRLALALEHYNAPPALVAHAIIQEWLKAKMQLPGLTLE